jgi:orotate phosphoribosyltransferase
MNSEFLKFLVKKEVAGFNPDGITLKSGRISYWYVNCRKLIQDLKTLDKASDFVIYFLRERKILTKDTDVVLGVPEGSLLLGMKTSEKLIKSKLIPDVIYIQRIKEKKHGDLVNRYWVNGNVPKKVILIEDSVTTGGSVLELAIKLRDAGIKIQAIVSLVNRCQLDEKGKSVVQNMRDSKFKYYSLTTASELLPYLLSKGSKKEKEYMVSKLKEEYLCDYITESKLPKKIFK